MQKEELIYIHACMKLHVRGKQNFVATKGTNIFPTCFLAIKHRIYNLMIEGYPQHGNSVSIWHGGNPKNFIGTRKSFNVQIEAGCQKASHAESVVLLSNQYFLQLRLLSSFMA